MNERLVIGYDYGGRDWTAIAMFQQTLEASGKLHLVELAVRESIGITYDIMLRKVNAMYRDRERPKGYSQSHWRKIWKQRSALRVTGDPK